MASDDGLPKVGFRVPQNEDGKTDGLGQLAEGIFENIFYNIVHGIVLQTHREEKIARAASAAIIAAEEAVKRAKSKSKSSNSAFEPIVVTTDSAICEDQRITLIGNPLQTLPAEETRCPKCSLPRLLHPTSGNAPEPPNSKKQYCTRHPFTDKPGHDIYGQSFPTEATGPEKGRKKSRLEELGAADGTDTSNALDESTTASPPPSSPQSSPNTFPNVKCPSCSRPLVVRRFAAHLAKCLGGNRRPSGRTAQLKMNGSNLSSSQSSFKQPNISTPPAGSRRGTPVPSKKTAFGPQKRDRVELGEYDENYDSEEDEPRKKKPKPPVKKKDPSVGEAVTGVTKKWKSGRQTIDGKVIEGKIKLNLKLPKQLVPPPPSSRATSDAEAEPDGDFEDPNRESISSQTE